MMSPLSHNIRHNIQMAEVCMKGSIVYDADRGAWCISWPMDGKRYKVRRYKQNAMPVTAYGQDGLPDRRRCRGFAMATKLLSLMQARWEQHIEGKCAFSIEEFTGARWSDVCEFYRLWMAEVIEPNRRPATIHSYWSYFRNWIEPFFVAHPAMLHEIKLDTLNRLLNTLKLEPKGKLNVIMAVRSMLEYAWRTERIPSVPPFPKREQYGIVQRVPEWLSLSDRDKVMAQIPTEHKPIFEWLSLHYRRPGEACALHKADYDQINNAFWIRRALSKRQIVESTKTHAIHFVPCDSSFTATARRLINQDADSPYMFVNVRSRHKDKGGRYTLEALRNVWYLACKQAGVRRIWPYRGTKHTSCTAFIEDGGTLDELQMLTGHARRDSLKHYAEVTLARKRQLMERNKTKRAAQ